MTRVAIWDFDHNDQALMLPEAVRTLATLVAMGKRVYVHCTAGINRATLTVVGYLTFVQGWQLNDAVAYVKRKRPQANPYIDCWLSVRLRMTEGRTDEVMSVATRLYEDRREGRVPADEESGSDDFADWVAAEGILIQETFQRQIQANLTLVASLLDMESGRREQEAQGEVCMSEDDFEVIQAEMGMLRSKVDDERAALRVATTNLAQQAEEVRLLRASKPEVAALIADQSARMRTMKAAEHEISALKDAIRDVAMSTFKACKDLELRSEELLGAEQAANEGAEEVAGAVAAGLAVTEGVPAGSVQAAIEGATGRAPAGGDALVSDMQAAEGGAEGPAGGATLAGDVSPGLKGKEA